MASGCSIGFEVSKTTSGMIRSVVFVSRRSARAFQKSNPGSKLRAVELCEGRIKRRGKSAFLSGARGVKKRRK